MATTIDQHSGSTKMGCFIICVNVQATVALTENQGAFDLYVSYSYSGSKSGSGNVTVPVSGNTSGQKQEPSSIVLAYEITNWSLTDNNISFDLTASISHTSFPSMGPDYIFNNQQFKGARQSVKIQADDARFAKYIALHNALQKSAGVSVEDVYKV